MHKYLKIFRFKIVIARRLGNILGVHVIRKVRRTKAEPQGILIPRGWGDNEEVSGKSNQWHQEEKRPQRFVMTENVFAVAVINCVTVKWRPRTTTEFWNLKVIVDPGKSNGSEAMEERIKKEEWDAESVKTSFLFRVLLWKKAKKRNTSKRKMWGYGGGIWFWFYFFVSKRRYISQVHRLGIVERENRVI